MNRAKSRRIKRGGEYPMMTNRGLGLMLVLCSLSTVGCTAAREPYLFRKKPEPKFEKPELDKRDELIRDLSMYSD